MTYDDNLRAGAADNDADSSTTHARLLMIILEYHRAARDELVSRLKQREASIFFFLASSSALFGFSFGGTTIRPAFLFLVPLLGLGAAYMYAQHNDIIGLLAEYCGVELAEQAVRCAGGENILPFDSSSTILSSMTYVKWRLTSSLVLILLPSISALGIAVAISPATGGVIIAAIVDAALGVQTVRLLVVSEWLRRRRLVHLRNSLHAQRSQIAARVARVEVGNAPLTRGWLMDQLKARRQR